jgi:hypothetical protein
MQRWVLLCHASESSGFFKLSDHHIRGNDGRIVVHGIDLPEILPTACHLFYTGQPFQGCFAHVVSRHIEDNPGVAAGLSCAGPQKHRSQRNPQYHCHYEGPMDLHDSTPFDFASSLWNRKAPGISRDLVFPSPAWEQTEGPPSSYSNAIQLAQARH